MKVVTELHEKAVYGKMELKEEEREKFFKEYFIEAKEIARELEKLLKEN